MEFYFWYDIMIVQQAAIAAVLHVKRDLHHLELSPWEGHNLEDLISLLGPFKVQLKFLVDKNIPIFPVWLLSYLISVNLLIR